MAGAKSTSAGDSVQEMGTDPRCGLANQLGSVAHGPSSHCKLSPSLITKHTVCVGAPMARCGCLTRGMLLCMVHAVSNR
eukprot:m.83706 g.83706  ORF g.83706 m.83706 type:complete len:79 (+) comp16351_c0_seq9:4268-4504(+)